MWQNGTLHFHLDEIGCPLPKKVRGQVRVTPTAVTGQSFELTADGRHTWQPVAPHATVSVDLEKPDLSWRGNGYIDSNFGVEPLEDGFSDWTWSRAHRQNDSLMYYTANLLEGGQSHLGLKVTNGNCEIVAVPPAETLNKTGWRMARSIRSDSGTTSLLKSTLEDTPFYARSLVEAQLRGQRVVTIHESLCLKRFRSPWVRMLLPFRMPRRVF
jgi:carotenoid 1,2-hydratase